MRDSLKYLAGKAFRPALACVAFTAFFGLNEISDRIQGYEKVRGPQGTVQGRINQAEDSIKMAFPNGSVVVDFDDEEVTSTHGGRHLLGVKTVSFQDASPRLQRYIEKAHQIKREYGLG